MTTHLYCVLPLAEHGTLPLGLSGVSGERVRALPVSGLVAWVSDVERAVAFSVEGVRAHDAVVEAALETGTTPVPVRFGQRFADDEACRAALANRAESVQSLLDTMQGFVEMTLLIAPSARRMVRDLEPVLPDMFDPAEQGAGKRYLNALRKREMATGAVGHASDTVTARYAEAVNQYVAQTRDHQAITPMPLRTISHLVARTDMDAYRAAAAAVPLDAEFRVLVIGPRAPYSFSALRADGSAHGMILAD